MLYELHYINSKSEKKVTTFESGEIKNGQTINRNTILPISRQLMDNVYYCAMTELIEFDGETKNHLFQADMSNPLKCSYVSVNGENRPLQIPLGSYMQGDILTKDNAQELIPKLAKQWGGDYVRVLQPLTDYSNQTYNSEYLRITYMAKKHPHHLALTIQADQLANMECNKLLTQIAESTYSDDMDYTEFEEITRHTYKRYKIAIDTATIVSEKNGASVEIPITSYTIRNRTYEFNNYDIQRMRINGIDDVNPNNLRIEPTKQFGVVIPNLCRNRDYLDDEMQFRGVDVPKLMSNSGKITVEPKQLKSHLLDKLKDWNNQSPIRNAESLLVDRDGDPKTASVTLEWYGDSQDGQSGITMRVTQSNHTRTYFIDSPNNDSQVRVQRVRDGITMTYSNDIPSLRRCLNTIISTNEQTNTISNLLTINETPDLVQPQPSPLVKVQLPPSIQSRLDEINGVKDNLKQLIGDDLIEQEVLNAKIERVDNAVNIYNELSQAHPEKASTYLERFENALDNIKEEFEAKTASRIEHDAQDFEIALRMLELKDNHLSQ